MGRKSIEDVMNEIEDFLNSCKTTALSSNKVVVPRDEFDELFGDLKVKIPAEIDRCKKIMRNKEAILMDARKSADEILAQAGEQANRMVSETEIMAQANQKAYETIEMARVQANEILAQASSEANEIRLGSMQYTNDLMMGIRNYVEATLAAERANYENLIQVLNNDYVIANANLDEIQSQIVEFTGDPNSVTRAPQIKTTVQEKEKKSALKTRSSIVQRAKQAVSGKEDKAAVKEETKSGVDIPDFIAREDKVVQDSSSEEKNVPVKKGTTQKSSAVQAPSDVTLSAASEKSGNDTLASTEVKHPSGAETAPTKKVKKKIVKKRNPVIQTPQTAQETVAKTLEAAAAAKVDKTVYKANGEQAREVPPMEGRVKRGPRVGRGLVEEAVSGSEEKAQTDADTADSTKSLGIVDDFTMEEKI